MSSPSFWKFIAGVAVALGACLVGLSVFLLVRDALDWGPVGLLYALIYVGTILVGAVPLILLGTRVWRRARRSDSN